MTTKRSTSESTPTPQPQSSSNHWLCEFQDNIIFDLGGGKRVCQIRYIINSFKGVTIFYLAFLMWYYQNYTLGAYVYAALHGSYGWLWLSKDLTFPDKTWQREVTFGSFLVFLFGNLLFWSMGWIAMSGNGIADPTYTRVAVSIMIMIFGSTLMLVSDAQKYFTLRLRPGVLISDGTFKYTRNPNYLGESVIYLSFAVISANIVSYAIVFLQIGLFFNVMTKVKDIRSYSLKQGWKQYQITSGRILPKIAGNSLLTYAIYGIVGVIILMQTQYADTIIAFLSNMSNK